MNSRELLKSSRNLLLGLHKSLVDFERSIYEGIYGTMTGGQFLNVLIEDKDFAWLRKFSTLIVDIDEMFAQKDGYTNEQVDQHLTQMIKLIEMNVDDDDFRAKYQAALHQDSEAAAKQGMLKSLLTVPNAAAGE